VVLGKNCHIVTIGLWTIVRICEATDGHSGYEFSWSPYRLLPMSGSASYHDYHHTHNVGNYSSIFSIWDTVFGTDKDYYIHRSKLE